MVSYRVRGAEAVVSGNTYPVRSDLRRAGCTWNPARKEWTIPANLVASLRGIARPTGFESFPNFEDMESTEAYIRGNHYFGDNRAFRS